MKRPVELSENDAGTADGVAVTVSPRLPVSVSLSWVVRKYWKILRASLIERMAYRGDFLLGTVLRFLPMVTTILLWQAIYGGNEDRQLSGFTFRQMIAYLLLVHISRMFSSMPGLAGGIARDIREGTLKKYLIQPVDMIGYLLSYRAAHKAAYIVTSFVPYALLFFLCRAYFDHWPAPRTLAAYAVSLLLAFVVGFFFEAAIGMIGFWFLEVSSVLYVVNTLNFFISGHMFPLDLLPQPWAWLLKALPFQYMAYFPAAVFLEKVRGPDLVYGLVGEFVWAAVFMVLARWLYRLGLRRYSAYGG
ncbi:MAG TPA: ABC-2 family transporter protein [Gemmataceae bacterium]|jgi:ABC-2 type transport system permease protein|nr:ABC-2 family transporter protein [Gemmataceae bacterium]